MYSVHAEKPPQWVQSKSAHVVASMLAYPDTPPTVPTLTVTRLLLYLP